MTGIRNHRTSCKLVSIVASYVQSSVSPTRQKMLPKMACKPTLTVLLQDFSPTSFRRSSQRIRTVALSGNSFLKMALCWCKRRKGDCHEIETHSLINPRHSRAYWHGPRRGRKRNSHRRPPVVPSPVRLSVAPWALLSAVWPVQSPARLLIRHQPAWSPMFRSSLYKIRSWSNNRSSLVSRPPRGRSNADH